MIGMIMMVKWYSGNHVGLKLPDICLTGEEIPRKNSTQETCPDRRSNPARCVTGTHATACSTCKKHLISLPEFILLLIGSFTWITPPGPYRATTCRGRELISGSHTFLTTQEHGGLPRMRCQLNAGATSETAQTWKMIHSRHILRHSNKANMKSWLRRPNDIRGSCGPKVSWHLFYMWGKTPKKLTQETCPDRGSNPGPLRDRRACYRLFHSVGSFTIIRRKKEKLKIAVTQSDLIQFRNIIQQTNIRIMSRSIM